MKFLVSCLVYTFHKQQRPKCMLSDNRMFVMSFKLVSSTVPQININQPFTVMPADKLVSYDSYQYISSKGQFDVY